MSHCKPRLSRHYSDLLRAMLPYELHRLQLAVNPPKNAQLKPGKVKQGDEQKLVEMQPIYISSCELLTLPAGLSLNCSGRKVVDTLPPLTALQ
jgi:hypothetical protein